MPHGMPDEPWSKRLTRRKTADTLHISQHRQMVAIEKYQANLIPFERCIVEWKAWRQIFLFQETLPLTLRLFASLLENLAAVVAI